MPVLAEDAECVSSDQCPQNHWCALSTLDSASFTCVPSDRVGIPCLGGCGGDLVCRLASINDSVETCQPPPDLGEPCATGICPSAEHVCRPTNTSNVPTCELPAEVGELCRSNRECELGSACVEDRSIGTASCGACTDNMDCGRYDDAVASPVPELCVDGICEALTSVTGTLKDGAGCALNGNCMSGWCSSEICITPTADEIYCLDLSGE